MCSVGYWATKVLRENGDINYIEKYLRIATKFLLFPEYGLNPLPANVENMVSSE